jgi:hypothetical protein
VYKGIKMKKTLKKTKNNFSQFFIKISLSLFVFFLIGCISLSQKVQEQNINIVTSEYMVQGKQNVHAYTIESGEAINEMGIIAANKAANEGWSDITILVKYIGSAGGYFVYGAFISNNIYEISYWKE